MKAPEMTMTAPQPCEREHEFTLVLAGISELTPAVEDALFKAGCDDATLAVRSGRVFVTFSRKSATIQQAILSAIRDIRNAKIGADVRRIDVCDLVTQADIARRIDRTRQLVHQYILGTRGPGMFPPPACQLADAAPLWYWCDVAHWLWENNMISEQALRDVQVIDAINTVLELEHCRQAEPDLIQEVTRALALPPSTGCGPVP